MSKINWTHHPTCESPDGRYFAWECRGGRVAVMADVGTSGRWRAIWARTGCESASDSSDPSAIASEVEASIRYCGGIAEPESDESEPIQLDEIHAKQDSKSSECLPAHIHVEGRITTLESELRKVWGAINELKKPADPELKAETQSEPDWHAKPDHARYARYGVLWWCGNTVSAEKKADGWLVILWSVGLGERQVSRHGLTPEQAALTVRVFCGDLPF